MSISYVFPAISGAYVPEPPKPRRSPSRGYDPARMRAIVTILTDAEVIEARWLREYGGWKCGRIAEHYGVDPTYMARVLSYVTRSSSRLFPNPDSFPAGHQPAARADEKHSYCLA